MCGPPREAMAEGAVLLRGFAKPFESELIAALREIVAQAPFRHMSRRAAIRCRWR